MSEEPVSTCLYCHRTATEKCGECGVGYCDQHLEVDKDVGNGLCLCSKCLYKHYKERAAKT